MFSRGKELVTSRVRDAQQQQQPRFEDDLNVMCSRRMDGLAERPDTAGTLVTSRGRPVQGYAVSPVRAGAETARRGPLPPLRCCMSFREFSAWYENYRANAPESEVTAHYRRYMEAMQQLHMREKDLRLGVRSAAGIVGAAGGHKHVIMGHRETPAAGRPGGRSGQPAAATRPSPGRAGSAPTSASSALLNFFIPSPPPPTADEGSAPSAGDGYESPAEESIKSFDDHWGPSPDGGAAASPDYAHNTVEDAIPSEVMRFATMELANEDGDDGNDGRVDAGLRLPRASRELTAVAEEDGHEDVDDDDLLALVPAPPPLAPSALADTAAPTVAVDDDDDLLAQVPLPPPPASSAQQETTHILDEEAGSVSALAATATYGGSPQPVRRGKARGAHKPAKPLPPFACPPPGEPLPLYIHTASLSKKQVSQMLDFHPDGTFLVRQRPGHSDDVVLGLVFHGQPTHHLIRLDESGSGLLTVNKTQVGPGASTLFELIEQLKQPLEGWPCPLRFPLERQEDGPISTAGAGGEGDDQAAGEA